MKGAFNRSAVGTLVERKTRLVVLVKMAGCDAKSALRGFRREFKKVPPDLRQTLTYDRGSEMAFHETLAKQLSIDIYFADPTHPGSGVVMKTPIVCFASTCLKALICRSTLNVSSIKLPIGSNSAPSCA
ncbi:MAG: IS30 family transposase [Gammaproteobacteria bacterium]|nr:MAG: IS30 family transposase [Gammaproteobacteria bacterium]